MRREDGNYYLGVPVWRHPDFKDEYVPRMQSFINLLKDKVEQYYASEPDRCTNYEDLYYVASQIRDNEIREHDNPALQPFIDLVRRECQDILRPQPGEVKSAWSLYDLADEATHYIGDALWHLLYKEPFRTDHLDMLVDASLDTRLSHVAFFTLNHDTVFERILAGHGIAIADGFDSPVNNVRYWAPHLFRNPPHRVRLLKLHGSVNWFRFVPDDGGWGQETIGIPIEWDFWHTKGVHGESQWPVDGRPLVLAGTFNKMLHYSQGIFADLHCQFRWMLRDVEHLVVCGYSFRDKGINSQIIEWLYSRPGRTIVVIHPRAEKLKCVARGAVSQKWEEWIDGGRLLVYPKKIEEASWVELGNMIRSKR